MTTTHLSFPLDDGFLRRECPYCYKEFKVLLEPDELARLEEQGIASFLLTREKQAVEPDEQDPDEVLCTCPYCGQQAPQKSWWTQEQCAYIKVVVRNMLAKTVNEQFIRPMKQRYSGSGSGMISLRFEGKEMKCDEPWMSPEIDDMRSFDLPCCGRMIKVQDEWHDTIHCFFCSFPHRQVT